MPKKQKMNKWAVEINKGPTQKFETRTSLYVLAAGAALAMLEYPEPLDTDGADIVKIWCPELIKHVDEYQQFKPMFYAFHEGRIFHLVDSINKELVW